MYVWLPLPTEVVTLLMKYWFLTLPRPDMEHCIKVGTFGLSRKHLLGKVSKGDKVVCCASKDWQIIATGEATSGYYLDDKPIFLKEGTFPDRFDFQAGSLSSLEELPLKEVIDQLGFVTNLAYWAVYFRTGIVEISKADWDVVKNGLKRQSSG